MSKKTANCDLTGLRFGRLVVLRKYESRESKHDIYWLCKCDCGCEKTVTTGHLTSRTVQSCGCLRREQAVGRFKADAEENVIHGEAGSPLYAVWHSMIQRCENQKLSAYKWYGGKGVKVCKEWHDFSSFSRWAHSHGYKDEKGVSRKDRLSIDRIDSNLDYCPENCRWVSVSENTSRGAKSRWENARNSNRSSGTTSTFQMA